jgi:hypothetical protein
MPGAHLCHKADEVDKLPAVIGGLQLEQLQARLVVLVLHMHMHLLSEYSFQKAQEGGRWWVAATPAAAAAAAQLNRLPYT